MVWALVEGLAGVVDRGRTLDAVRLSPRWLAAGVDEAEVSVGYAASGASVEYRYRRRQDRVDARGERPPARTCSWHVLLPAGHRRGGGSLRRRERSPVEHVRVESSPYADGSCRVQGVARIEIDITAA